MNSFVEHVSDPSTLFYLISSHGRYELVDTINPRTPNPYSYVIPENTYVIETLDIGRLCASTIDKPLWNLLQPANRDKFVGLLTKKGGLNESSPELLGIHNFTNRRITPIEYINVLKNFIIYLPGMRVPLRTLLFAGDVKLIPNPDNPAVKIADYKLSYRGFGVYKFPLAGAGKPIAAPFPKAKGALETNASKFNLKNISTMFNKSNIFENLESSSLTNKIITEAISARNESINRVIFYSSCGEYAINGSAETKEKRRTTLMRIVQLQRKAMHNAYGEGFKQFLYREPVKCPIDIIPFLNFVMENAAPAEPAAAAAPAAARLLEMPANYKTTFFNRLEEYEGNEIMFIPQDFAAHGFSYFLTPLESCFLHAKSTKADQKTYSDFLTNDDNKQLYIDFLNHRAEMWYENLLMYIKGEDEHFDGKLNTYYLSLSGNEEKADIKENIELAAQMVCWTIRFSNLIITMQGKNLENANEIKEEIITQLKQYKAEIVKQRSEKSSAGGGSRGDTHRRSRKNLKRRRQSKRQYRVHN
jgi:hypothetical protein